MDGKIVLNIEKKNQQAQQESALLLPETILM